MARIFTSPRWAAGNVSRNNMEQVYTIEQYKALPPKQRVSLDEYEVEFINLGDNGFWAFCSLWVYAEGKDAHSKIEEWLKGKYPLATDIKVVYQ